MIYNADVEELVEEKTKEKVNSGKVLVLHNDDWNTFDHVESCLISICKHSPHQAAQCALIVHFKGKCDVKRGEDEELKKMYAALKREELSVTLEED